MIAEEYFPFDKEISVVAARFSNGKIYTYEPSENIHKNHILDLSINPALIQKDISMKAKILTKTLLKELNYVGVLALEFFLKGRNLVCNEFAPRPHNSGHFSMDASNLSQFDLQLRSLCNLYLDEDLKSKPCVMKNIMGENYTKELKKIPRLLKSTDFHLHLYQKEEPRLGRKMGHWNYTGKFSKNVTQIFK
ncbi:MAG: ATP-grasp domain-containing protein [Leptospiraceae bacterium]|nr:ATP-grasp domain-containing protein [Leptospiraceae bacterium]